MPETYSKFCQISKMLTYIKNPSTVRTVYSDIFTEAAIRGVLWKKTFSEISQNSQENTHARVSFLKKFIKNWHRCFPVNFVKFLTTPFLQNTSGRLLPYSGQSAIFSHVQTYWRTLRHIEVYSGIIVANWAIFKTLCDPFVTHILNPDICRTWVIFKSLSNMQDR